MSERGAERRGCDAEVCPFWTGDGCACDLLDVDEDLRLSEKQRIEEWLS